MTLALIDADIVAFRCAASAENEDEAIALWRVGDLMQRILHETEATTFNGHLTGSHNFRYDIYPNYKANRKDKPRPRHLGACREALVTQWQCRVTDGIEADDALGIDHQANPGSVLASIDKDLLQLPGRHYNFVKQQWHDIDELQGLRNFYTQLIEGDASDNIPAFDGKFRNKRPIFVQKLIDPLYEMTEEKDMFCYAESVYTEPLATMLLNAQLLYIHKKDNDKWINPIMMESGVPGDSEVLSAQLSAVPPNDGPQNTVA